MRHISTTIKKIYFEMKMQDLERDGYFYEYKEDKPYWHKRMQKLPLGKVEEAVEIVFLVGNVPHRFKVINIEWTNPGEIPERYASAIETEYVYAIKVVLLENKTR